MLATFKTCIARALFIPPVSPSLSRTRTRARSSRSYAHRRIDISQLRSPIVCRNILHVSSVMCLGRTVSSNSVKILLPISPSSFSSFFFFSPAKIPLTPYLLPRQRSETRILLVPFRDSVLSSPINLNVECYQVSRYRFDSIVPRWTTRVLHERVIIRATCFLKKHRTCISPSLSNVFL